MVQQTVIIRNLTGLHLRPAGVLCNEAVKYKSKICFKYGDNEANAKSVLSVLGAGIKSGTQLEFICEGEDENEALAAMIAAVEGGLGE
jgi:phosphocarrier protein